jgi:pimeloyl-ACP methyl ester carboxylesterase
MKRLILLLLTGIIFLLGCAPKHSKPDLGEIYNRSAEYHDEKRNPIILIPGILGSRLVDSRTGQVVWGAFSGDAANPREAEGARLIALPIREGAQLSELRDDVVPDGALESLRVDVFRLPIEISAYVDVMGALGVGGYRDEQLSEAGAIDYGDEHFTCFQFAYDWRRDNVENAKRLHRFILDKRAYVQKEYEKRYGVSNYDVKFDIIAHSMGGLISRYYLRYGPENLPEDGSLPPLTWAGSRFVERAILIAPPNAGSLQALLYLINGRKFGPGLPRYEPALLGTFPSLYQLLPRERHVPLVRSSDETKPVTGIMDPDLWEEMGWGLAASNQKQLLQELLESTRDPESRRRAALDHQRKCLHRADSFLRALDVPASPPEDLTLYLFAGDALPTPAVASVNMEDGSVRTIENKPGDETVLRSSALMDERVDGMWVPTLVSPVTWNQVLFLFSEHLEMTRTPAFTDNLLFILLEQP